MQLLKLADVKFREPELGGQQGTAMIHTILCHSCDDRLTDVSNAVRHHGSVVHTAMEVAQGDITEEEWKGFKDNLAASFLEAHAAWDAYREHLIEHGLLRNLPSQRDVA